MLTKQELNKLSLGAFKPLFMSLAAPTLAEIKGDYRSSIPGPSWFRTIAGPSLALGGLGHWRGKRFDGRGGGVNLVEKDGHIVETLPMEVVLRPSAVDGKPAVAIVYPPGSRFPWPYVIDELRQLDKGRLLGVSYVNRQPLRGLVTPFLLDAAEEGL